MRARTILTGLMLCAAAAIRTAPAAAASDVDGPAAFSRLAALVGEWRSEDGKDTLVYELIAGGTALLERETSTERPAMVTLYHRDGRRLVLTHYCMAGNQPRMVARRFDAGTGELAFEFLDATNLAAPGAGHMRNVTIRLVDRSHLETEWQFYENGQAAMTERARYVRVPRNRLENTPCRNSCCSCTTTPPTGRG
jgi:hypothetical protein